MPDDSVNILLVDDHEENLLALEAILGDLGENLIRAQSGPEALKQLLQRDFAVILLDVQMPGMDGFEVATLIRERTRSHSTPIIFLTAISTSETHVFQGYALGAVDYLFKPFAPDILRSKVVVFVDLFKKTREVEQQLAETRRLNAELADRNAAIARLNRDLAALATAESGLRSEVLQWRQAEEQVRHEKEAADEANQAKSEFLAGISHELRTPLTAILGYAALLQRTELVEKQQKYIAAIQKAGNHLLDLINEVLDITRVEVNQLDLIMEPVAVAGAIELARHMVVPLAEERQVHVSEELPAADEVVLADPQRLKQVLLNLMVNAVKYNTQGGWVRFSCEHTPAGVRISVHDTGPGIPPEKHARLFAPFDRLDAQDTGIEGTGLGLALSKRLVEAMGGTIGVESAPGSGSTFWIELARAPVPVGAAG